MLGAIIGDIVGSRWEFNPTNDYGFELFSDKNGYTDDTICTVAVADAILRDRDFGESIHDWCNRYPHPMGSYGGRFAQWVHSDNPQPYNSFGNGAAMRISPVAWAAHDLEFKYLMDMAEQATACTHNHPEGIKGAQTVALAIQYGIELSSYHPIFEQEQIKELVNTCANRAGYNINIRKEDIINKFDETCQGTVPVALWIIGQSSSFEDAIRRAVSLGADADTLGAIVGSIAEAIWGIPEEMQMKALKYLPKDMKIVVLRFYSRFVKESILHGYGDEGAARDLMLEEEQEEMKKQTDDDDEKKQFQAVMLWKLGLGNMGKFFAGQKHMPDKTKVAKPTSWKTEPMPRTDISKIAVGISITEEDMTIIRKGHIPEAQEDHWFMYCSRDYIRYYRSWTGTCSFEAHFHKKKGQYIIDEITINHALVEFGVNGDEPGVALFLYLLIAEVGGNAMAAWHEYLDKWEKNHLKYSTQAEIVKDNNENSNQNNIDSDPSLDDIYEEREIIEPKQGETFSNAPANAKKNQPRDEWYQGYKGHVCEGCIYTNGIRRWTDDPNSGVMGCGRLGYNSFRRNYTSGECDYRKTDLFIPSVFEKERKEEALRKKREEEEEMLRQYRKEQRLLKLDKQDGTYERQLIKDFVEHKLDGDINRLVDFDFHTIENDDTYGNCRGFAFSVEKTNIMKAIMAVTFGDLWPGLTQDSLDDYTYNVTRVNEMHYLFGANILDKYFKAMQEFHPTKEQHQRAVTVSHLLDTLGNMWVLPGHIDADKDTYHYHGYVDLFLKDVYNAMTGKGKVRPDVKGTIYNARKQMGHLQGAEGFDKMARGLLLDDFLDYYGNPTDVLPQIWFSMKFLKREVYFKAVDDYCAFMEHFVPKRGKLIVEKLKRAMAQDNLAKKHHIDEILEEERQNAFSNIGYKFLKAIDRIVAEKGGEDKSHFLNALDALSLEDGYALGLKLPCHEGMGDKSSFYIYCKNKEAHKKKNDIPVPQGITDYNDEDYEEEDKYELFNHILVKRTAMGIWQAYLLSIAPTVLPTFWHGGYIRRTYIFAHQDLAKVDELFRKDEPLYSIKDFVSPKVKIRGYEGTIECCYWNEWEGLVRETLKVTYGNNTVLSFKRIKEEVLYEYDCGICF